MVVFCLKFNPEGVVIVKFESTLSAEKCVQVSSHVENKGKKIKN
jgi:hypothetical protein